MKIQDIPPKVGGTIFITKGLFLSKKNSQTNWEFYNKVIVNYLLLSLILAFLPVSSLK